LTHVRQLLLLLLLLLLLCLRVQLQLQQLCEEFSQQPPNLQYPSYYTVPFHAYDDGNLCWQVWRHGGRDELSSTSQAS
jgi:hypothetical protein